MGNSQKNKTSFSDALRSSEAGGRIGFFITIGLILIVIAMAVIGICCTDTSSNGVGNTPEATSKTHSKEELIADFKENAADYNEAVSNYLASQSTTTAPEATEPTAAAQ